MTSYLLFPRYSLPPDAQRVPNCAMRIAILQNNTDDGPTYLATWLTLPQRQTLTSLTSSVVTLLHPRFPTMRGLAILGGVMGVNDDLLPSFAMPSH